MTVGIITTNQDQFRRSIMQFNDQVADLVTNVKRETALNISLGIVDTAPVDTSTAIQSITINVGSQPRPMRTRQRVRSVKSRQGEFRRRYQSRLTGVFVNIQRRSRLGTPMHISTSIPYWIYIENGSPTIRPHNIFSTQLKLGVRMANSQLAAGARRI